MDLVGIAYGRWKAKLETRNKTSYRKGDNDDANDAIHIHISKGNLLISM